MTKCHFCDLFVTFFIRPGVISATAAQLFLKNMLMISAKLNAKIQTLRVSSLS